MITKTEAGRNRRKAIINNKKHYNGRNCRKCKESKRYTSTGDCVNCVLTKMKREYHDNPHIYLNKNKKWREKNPEKWTESYQKAGKKWYDRNKKEKNVKVQKYREENRIWYRDYTSHWETTPLGKFRKDIKAVCRRLNANTLPKNKRNLLSFTPEEWEKNLTNRTKYSSIQESYKDNMTIEHIYPIRKIAAANISDELKFKIAMDLTNVMLLIKDKNTCNYENPKTDEVKLILEQKYKINLP